MSPALADAYLQAGMRPERMRMIPQGVDVERYRPAADRASLRLALGAAEDEPVLAFLGSLIERKGIDVLLAAWEMIHRERPSALLWLVGRDPFDEDRGAGEFLERCFAGVSPSALARVRRFGVRDDAERFLQAADVFVLPSRREGFGTAIIEAMACGLPCVVGELAGITEFIFRTPAANGGDGLVVPQEDPAALASAALGILSDAKRSAAIGARARERVRERFSIERIADEYLDWYRELLHRHGASR
jgi:glycosyltransferase involved in cell wall biosynthesis